MLGSNIMAAWDQTCSNTTETLTALYTLITEENEYRGRNSVENFLESLCCIREHYESTLVILGHQVEKTKYDYKSDTNSLKTFWTKLVINDIKCLLELLIELEAQLMGDKNSNAHMPGPGTKEFGKCFFNHLVKFKGIWISGRFENECQRITKTSGLCATDGYGVTIYNECTCKLYSGYMKRCQFPPEP